MCCLQAAVTTGESHTPALPVIDSDTDSDELYMDTSDIPSHHVSETLSFSFCHQCIDYKQ